MPNRFLAGSMLLLCLVAPGFGQTNQTPAPPSADTSSTSQSANSAPTDAKKVWTNDDMHRPPSGVSVVGDKRNQNYHISPAQTADPATIARMRKNLDKLTAQLDDANHKLTELKKFQAGDDVNDGGRQINKGLNRTPVDQQIAQLESSKKKLQMEIGDLLDEARKKGIEPGQLR